MQKENTRNQENSEGERDLLLNLSYEKQGN